MEDQVVADSRGQKLTSVAGVYLNETFNDALDTEITSESL